MKKTVFCIIALMMALLLCAAASAETVEIYQSLQSFPYNLTLPDISGFTYEGVTDEIGRYIGTVTIHTGKAELEDVFGYYVSPDGSDTWGTMIPADITDEGIYQIQAPEGYAICRFSFIFKNTNNAKAEIQIGVSEIYGGTTSITIQEAGLVKDSFYFDTDNRTGKLTGSIGYYKDIGPDNLSVSYYNNMLEGYTYYVNIGDNMFSGQFDKSGKLEEVWLYIVNSKNEGHGYYYYISENRWTHYSRATDWFEEPSTEPSQYDVNKIIRYLNSRAGGLQVRPTDVSRDFSKDGGIEVKNGLVNENGQWVLYKDGEVDTGSYGIMEYNGGRFFVANGAIIPNSGLVSDGTAWYYLSSGQVADYTGLASYDGAWFYVTNGILDTGRNGIVSYDGAQFMLAAGRIVTEANGLIQDPVSGIWYFVSAGQVASNYRGLALYDGQWFYVWDGVFQSNAEGWVQHDGATFYVVNGMVTGN